MTRKRSAQLDREIAAALRKGKSHHSTRKEDLWDVAMDAIMEGNAKRAVKIVQEIRASDDMNPAPITFYDALQAAPRDVRTLFNKLTSHTLDTPEARRIIAEHRVNAKPFKDSIDGKRWLDIPFAYDPYWEKRAR